MIQWRDWERLNMNVIVNNWIADMWYQRHDPKWCQTEFSAVMSRFRQKLFIINKSYLENSKNNMLEKNVESFLNILQCEFPR